MRNLKLGIGVCEERRMRGGRVNGEGYKLIARAKEKCLT